LINLERTSTKYPLKLHMSNYIGPYHCDVLYVNSKVVSFFTLLN